MGNKTSKWLMCSVVTLFGFILFSCNQKAEIPDKQANEKEQIEIHSSLLGVGSVFVGEPGIEEFKKQQRLADNKTVKIRYHEEYVIATTWFIVNACGNDVGNIQISNDTIKLLYQQKAEELCASGDIEKVTYFIDNPDKKKWKIIQ